MPDVFTEPMKKPKKLRSYGRAERDKQRGKVSKHRDNGKRRHLSDEFIATTLGGKANEKT